MWKIQAICYVLKARNILSINPVTRLQQSNGGSIEITHGNPVLISPRASRKENISLFTWRKNIQQGLFVKHNAVYVSAASVYSSVCLCQLSTLWMEEAMLRGKKMATVII